MVGFLVFFFCMLFEQSTNAFDVESVHSNSDKGIMLTYAAHGNKSNIIRIWVNARKGGSHGIRRNTSTGIVTHPLPLIYSLLIT